MDYYDFRRWAAFDKRKHALEEDARVAAKHAAKAEQLAKPRR